MTALPVRRLPPPVLACLLTLAPATALAAPEGGASGSASAPASAPWLGEQLPLPLAVKTPQDLALKAAAERQYLIFRLLAQGKLAWDSGDHAAAAARWEELLQLPGLDPELDRVVRPLAADARTRAGGTPLAPPGGPLVTTAPSMSGMNAEAASAPPSPGVPLPGQRTPPTGPVVPMVMVSGEVSGGGSGPGGTVVWARRANAATPRPSPVRGKSMHQAGKAFLPRVLTVPVGSTVTFTNKDSVVHNVVSLSPVQPFDGGLARPGQTFYRTFTRAGVFEVLCNLHASERGHIVVVDSPWYTEANARGAFSIRGLAPGDYDLEAWNEGVSQPSRTRVRVGSEGVRGVMVKLGNGTGGQRAGGGDKSGANRP